VSQRSLTSPTSCFSADHCANYADGLVGKHQAYYRENEGGLASLAHVQGDRRGSPLPEPLPFPHQRRRRKGLVSVYRRPFSLVFGPILIIAGFVFIPTPGPSYIIIAIGLWLLAGEFLLLARLFDRVGARLGRLGRWIKGVWRGTPAAVKVLVVLTFAATLAYGAYKLFAG
jgi:hypothetical protein